MSASSGGVEFCSVAGGQQNRFGLGIALMELFEKRPNLIFAECQFLAYRDTRVVVATADDLEVHDWPPLSVTRIRGAGARFRVAVFC